MKEVCSAGAARMHFVRSILRGRVRELQQERERAIRRTLCPPSTPREPPPSELDVHSFVLEVRPVLGHLHSFVDVAAARVS